MAFPTCEWYVRFMPPYEHHIFVCGNQRPVGHPRGCCGEKGADEVRATLKEALVAHGLKGRVRANHAGCLDQCEHGVTVVIYPEGIWYGFVTPADVHEIVEEHLLNGRPVERLRMANSCINTKSCEHRPQPDSP